MFMGEYAEVFESDAKWQAIDMATSKTYPFSTDSTYIQLPPFFEDRYSAGKNKNIEGARLLALLGDSVTTDHISPAGAIPDDSPTAKYLTENGVERKDFNSCGSRRGNHEVMMRGTFGNIRIKNELVPGTEGGYTCRPNDPAPISIYDAAMQYLEQVFQRY